jgi:hypothetical protein
MALYRSKGQTYADTNAAAVAMLACTTFWFFRDSMALTVGAVNRAEYLQAVYKLRTWLALSTFGTRFDPNHHDGVAFVRHWAHEPSCGCMRYRGGNVSVD